MPDSPGNPAILLPIDKPNIAGGLQASGPPLTGLTGLRLNYPLSKNYISGAARRVINTLQLNSGATLSASTAYNGQIIIPRAALITAIYLSLGVSPTVAATLNITYNGTSILVGGPINIVSTSYTAGQVYKLPLITTGSLVVTSLPDASGNGGLPFVYLTPLNGAGGFPYPLVVTYTEAGSGTHSSNVVLTVESEPDDFNG